MIKSVKGWVTDVDMRNEMFDTQEQALLWEQLYPLFMSHEEKKAANIIRQTPIAPKEINYG